MLIRVNFQTSMYLHLKVLTLLCHYTCTHSDAKEGLQEVKCVCVLMHKIEGYRISYLYISNSEIIVESRPYDMLVQLALATYVP